MPNGVPRDIPSTRVFVSGATGSGKSHFIRARIMPRVPRAVYVDFVGEWERRRAELRGRVALAYSVHDARTRLAELAGVREWSLIVQIDPSEFAEMARLLVPPRFTDATPVYARAVGGVALVCDELDLLAPHNAPPDVLALWRRGRHVGLSIYAATQMPSAVHPTVRGMSRYLVLCQMHEVNAINYFRATVPPNVLDRLTGLPPHEAIVFDAHTRRAWHLNKRARVLWDSARDAE
ncbi:MAG: hypothetical protein AMXMBFR55_32970 [Gemmatimonadota bacterium]